MRRMNSANLRRLGDTRKYWFCLHRLAFVPICFFVCSSTLSRLVCFIMTGTIVATDHASSNYIPPFSPPYPHYFSCCSLQEEKNCSSAIDCCSMILFCSLTPSTTCCRVQVVAERLLIYGPSLKYAYNA